MSPSGGIFRVIGGVVGINYSSRHTFFVSLGVTLFFISAIGEFMYLTAVTTCGIGQISEIAFVPLVGAISGAGFYWRGDKKWKKVDTSEPEAETEIEQGAQMTDVIEKINQMLDDADLQDFDKIEWTKDGSVTIVNNRE